MRGRLSQSAGHATRRALAAIVLAALVVVVAAVGCTRADLTSVDVDGRSEEEEELRAELEECRAEHRVDASDAEVEALRKELRSYAAIADVGVRRRAAMRRAMDEYARGVCLVHGVFTLYEQDGPDERRMTGDDGGPFQLEYLGSGFLVSEAGHVATNRHVAQPWWNNERVLPLMRRGLRPRFVSLSVTFPGHDPVRVDPRTIRVSEDGVDLAVFRVAIPNVPVLPLSEQDPWELRGETLMLLGYPTGLAAILARAEPDVASAAIAESTDTESLIRALNARSALLPVSTHGTLNHVNKHKLIYDAATTSGGSGGPAFGPDGEVVGVNSAMLREFQGSNFGVPIRYVRALIR